MNGTILVTDSLFIFDEHVKQLEAAGYEVVRLDKPEATEEELCDAVKGKVGYILGGIEKITDKVIDATDELRAIVFTGTGWKGYVSGWENAKDKGIMIGNVPDATNYSVAEYVITLIMAMNRRIFELGRTGKASFKTVKSLSEEKVGIIGLGRIGLQTAKMLKGLGTNEVSYWSRNEKEEGRTLGIEHQSLEDIFSQCDIICVCVADDAGINFIDADLLRSMKEGSLIVSISHEGIINEDSLYGSLAAGKLRAAIDYVPQERFKRLPEELVYFPNATTAYNTFKTLRLGSDSSVETMLNLLQTGDDNNRVL